MAEDYSYRDWTPPGRFERWATVVLLVLLLTPFILIMAAIEWYENFTGAGDVDDADA